MNTFFKKILSSLLFLTCVAFIDGASDDNFSEKTILALHANVGSNDEKPSGIHNSDSSLTSFNLDLDAHFQKAWESTSFSEVLDDEQTETGPHFPAYKRVSDQRAREQRMIMGCPGVRRYSNDSDNDNQPIMAPSAGSSASPSNIRPRTAGAGSKPRFSRTNRLTIDTGNDDHERHSSDSDQETVSPVRDQSTVNQTVSSIATSNHDPAAWLLDPKLADSDSDEMPSSPRTRSIHQVENIVSSLLNSKLEDSHKAALRLVLENVQVLLEDDTNQLSFPEELTAESCFQHSAEQTSSEQQS